MTCELESQEERLVSSYPAPPKGRGAVTSPCTGRAVLACRCGAMLDLADMCRPRRHPHRIRNGIAIDPIQCGRCAGLVPPP
jgi:hypothetical protein